MHNHNFVYFRKPVKSRKNVAAVKRIRDQRRKRDQEVSRAAPNNAPAVKSKSTKALLLFHEGRHFLRLPSTIQTLSCFSMCRYPLFFFFAMLRFVAREEDTAHVFSVLCEGSPQKWLCTTMSVTVRRCPSPFFGGRALNLRRRIIGSLG